MAWFKNPLTKGLDIVDQFVEDKDKANELRAQFYLTELATKTHPLIDGVHKLGRQVLALAQIGFYAYCVTKDIPITWELVTGVSGVSGAYTLAKGKGK